MSDDRTTVVETAPSYSGALLGAIALAVLASLGGLVWSYALSNRLTRQEAALSEANQQNASQRGATCRVPVPIGRNWQFMNR